MKQLQSQNISLHTSDRYMTGM